MEITVLYFASVREAMGQASEQWATQATTVSGLREELVARGAPWADALDLNKALRCAVNQAMCDASTALTAGDEVAFFPPVTGG